MNKDNMLSQIPQTLSQLPRWILWKLETRDGNQTKVPYRIDGRKASTTNPNDWTDFDTAGRAFDPEKYNGLGFVLTKEDGIVCIDLDGCITDGKICEEALNIVRIMNSWTEISQSGRGLHIFIRGTKQTDKSKATPRTFKAIEVYDCARYIAMTGNHFQGTPSEIMERQGNLNAICALYFQKRESTPPQTVKPHHDSLRDEDIIALCRRANNAPKFEALFDRGDTSLYGNDESRADEALACLLAFYTTDAAQLERLMNASALARRDKWIQREDYRRLTIQNALNFTREHYHNEMRRNEAAATDHSPLEKHPLQSLTQQPQTHNSTAQTQQKLLLTKPFSSWLNEAKAQPPITSLFDVFWLSGELAFLFGSTNVGKTILAVQIADAIAKGAKIQGFDGVQKPMKVCLFDFELSARQFLKRYSDGSGNIHDFSPNFLRTEIDANSEIPKGISYQDYILAQIEQTIIEHRIEVAVIDNLTALLSNITETKDALELMRKLRLLKLRQNISMLVLSHSPKRDLSRPITKHDMVGSMHLLNLCDSAFAIGESVRESNVRYVKQVKTRSAEFKYDSENVATFRVVKNGCYLCFEHIGYDSEKEHLRERNSTEISELETNILTLHQSEPNLSYAEIAKRLNTSKSKVFRVLQKMNKPNNGVFNTPTPF
jgi:archaellum biogenesis ATPase FlaH